MRRSWRHLPFVLAACVYACGDGSEETSDTAGSDGGTVHAECAGTEDFAIGLERTGSGSTFTAHIVDAMPSTPEKYENDWIVELRDGDGNAVEDAEITAQPYMPTHGHDGTFDPEVMPGDEPGQYLVNRINLWMGGPWEVRLIIRAGGRRDYVVYDVCIED